MRRSWSIAADVAMLVSLVFAAIQMLIDPFSQLSWLIYGLAAIGVVMSVARRRLQHPRSSGTVLQARKAQDDPSSYLTTDDLDWLGKHGWEPPERVRRGVVTRGGYASSPEVELPPPPPPDWPPAGGITVPRSGCYVPATRMDPGYDPPGASLNPPPPPPFSPDPRLSSIENKSPREAQ